jgi:hypothetical protein
MKNRLKLRRWLIVWSLILAELLALLARMWCRSAALGKSSVPRSHSRQRRRARPRHVEENRARQSQSPLHPAHRSGTELFKSGKVRHLIVSGDNSVKHYDEPTDMRDALVAAGVPTNAITCDYAGFRTLDSVVRAKTVFGLTNFTIVTEAFHCPRSVWIAQRHGLERGGVCRA